MRIYISGPITGTDDYEERFQEAEEYLKKTISKCEIINPTMIKLPGTCTHDEYTKIDLKLLDLCDYIFMLEGWEKSRGACIEYGYALASDISIIKAKEEDY